MCIGNRANCYQQIRNEFLFCIQDIQFLLDWSTQSIVEKYNNEQASANASNDSVPKQQQKKGGANRTFLLAANKVNYVLHFCQIGKLQLQIVQKPCIFVSAQLFIRPCLIKAVPCHEISMHKHSYHIHGYHRLQRLHGVINSVFKDSSRLSYIIHICSLLSAHTVTRSCKRVCPNFKDFKNGIGKDNFLFYITTHDILYEKKK